MTTDVEAKDIPSMTLCVLVDEWHVCFITQQKFVKGDVFLCIGRRHKNHVAMQMFLSRGGMMFAWYSRFRSIAG